MARKTEKGGKFRNLHCRTWNMARKLKIMENENGEERVYSAYISILLLITKGCRTGTQAGQKAGADAEAMEGCSFLAYSACSLIEPKTTSPEMVPPTRGLAPLITN